MGYGLGVDLGTTFTAAAVNRDGNLEMATLGDRSAAVPSVVLLRPDGGVLTGDAADRRAATDPDRVAREVKRRLGDPMPLLLGGRSVAPEEVMAMQLRQVVGAVAEREGSAPDVVTLTHPANWGPHKRRIFESIPARAGLGGVRMITEPEAAAVHYAGTERVGDGELVAVYDLGGGTFDATVLRADGRGFAILGRPEGIEGLGGIDFDDAVLAHVDRAVGGAVGALDPSDPAATAAAIRLRHDCVLAKEALSADTEVTIPVILPGVQTEVRLTRREFETMIEPALAATIASLGRALRSAGVAPRALSTVLLVGGSSRIPVVSRMVSAELGRPTSVDAHPKHAIVLGAAAVTEYAEASQEPVRSPGAVAASTQVLSPVVAPGPAAPAAPLPPEHLSSAGTPAAGMPAPALAEATSRRRPRLPFLIAAAVLLLALAAGGAYLYSATVVPAAGSTVAPAAVPPPAPVPAVDPTVAATTARAPAAASPAPDGGTSDGTPGGTSGGGGTRRPTRSSTPPTTTATKSTAPAPTATAPVAAG